MIILGTVDTNRFWLFLKFLELIVEEEFSNQPKPLAMYLDNATHTSKATKRVTSREGYKSRFIAPNWPELASIEQFFCVTKSKHKTRDPEVNINFEKLSRTCDEYLEIYSRSHLGNAWITSIKEAKSFIRKIAKDGINSIENKVAYIAFR